MNTNQKAKVLDYLESIGFVNHPALSALPLVPSHYKDDSGTNILLSAIHVSTGMGDGLGCIVFSYHGKTRLKGHHKHNVNERPELLKEVFVAYDADKIIQRFQTWHKSAQATIGTWKKIF